MPTTDTPSPPSAAHRGRRRRVIAGSGVLLTVLATTAVVLAGGSWERRLARRGADALAATGHDGVVVEADGFGLRATGARSEAEAIEVAAVLATVPGVSRVDVPSPADLAGVVVVDPAAAVVTVTLSAGELVLSGQVPTRALKDRLLAAGTGAVGAAQVVDRLRAVDAPASATVDADVSALAVLVGRLPRDMVSATVTLEEGRRLSVAGTARAAASNGDGGLDAALDDLARRTPGLTIGRADRRADRTSGGR